MELFEAIRTRRTVGKSEGAVPRETIMELIEAATWAPNHKMTQPWRFTVLSGNARTRMGEVFGNQAAQSMDETQRASFIEGQIKKTLRAPTIIIVSTRTVADPMMAEEDLTATAAATQNLLLAAHAKGLSAAWKSGSIVYDPEVKRYLGLDPTDRIIAIIYLGTTAKEDVPIRPRDVTSVVHFMDDAALLSS